jgi:dTDP-4-dehydrorhamnose 3,5-epimerase
VLFDDRAGSPTHGTLQELFVGDSNYVLVRIPPMVWNGVKGLGGSPAMIANCASHAHDPQEMSRLDPFSDEIPYDWSLRHG